MVWFFFFLESYVANLLLLLRDVLKTHRTPSLQSHFLKKKVWSWGMEKQRESGREIWFNEPFRASMISFCSFVLLLIRVRGEKKCSYMERNVPWLALLCSNLPCVSVLLGRKNVNTASPLKAGISFSALNANGARFPFTSRKDTTVYHAFFFFFLFFSIGSPLLSVFW